MNYREPGRSVLKYVSNGSQIDDVLQASNANYQAACERTSFLTLVTARSRFSLDR